MSLRLVAIVFTLTLCACAAASQSQLAQADQCVAACQAKYDRCSDDSAKERSEPHTTCFEDYRDCAQKCDAKVASDPATKANQGVTVSEDGVVVVESGNTIVTAGAPVVSKGR